MLSSTTSHKLCESAGEAPLSTCHRPFCSVHDTEPQRSSAQKFSPTFLLLKPACHMPPSAGSHLRVLMDGSRHNSAELFVIHCQDARTVGIVGAPA